MKKLVLLILMVFALPGRADIAAALSHPDRSEADKALDATRRPAEIIEFFEIEPGMAVIDIFAGGGYYTEILSRVVGDTGFVTHYNNRRWDAFVAEAVDTRLGNDRLPNVDRYVASPEDLVDLPDTYAAAIFVLGMHDIYYADDENDWPLIEKERFLKGLYSVVEDGGVLGVIDHNAAPGSDPAMTGKSVHRVDPNVIIRDLEAAGFTLEARSDVLANPQDNYEISVFEESARRKTDRSVLKFRK